MSSTCPSCGYQDFEPPKTCKCGYYADESFIIDSFIKESDGTDRVEIEGKVPENPINSKNNKPVKESIIKEIDSWMFTFSESDKCICLSTPALQSFMLKFTLDDLEKLLEFMYQKTGKEKTTRKLRLSVEEVPDLIDKVHRMIEEKKSKITLNFDNDELEEIVDLINMKLKE